MNALSIIGTLLITNIVTNWFGLRDINKEVAIVTKTVSIENCWQGLTNRAVMKTESWALPELREVNIVIGTRTNVWWMDYGVSYLTNKLINLVPHDQRDYIIGTPNNSAITNFHGLIYNY